MIKAVKEQHKLKVEKLINELFGKQDYLKMEVIEPNSQTRIRNFKNHFRTEDYTILNKEQINTCNLFFKRLKGGKI